LAKLSPPQLKNYLVKANNFLINGNFKESELIYEEILCSYPSHPEALTMLATIYFNQHKLNEGIQIIEKSIQINPFQAEAFNNYAIALRELSQFDEALKKVEQAIKLNPNYYDAYYNQGLINRSKGLLNEAIQSYKKAIQLNKSSLDPYLNLSYIYIEYKDYREALSILDHASSIDFNISAIHYNKGLSFIGLNDYQNAIKSFDIALKLEPANFDISYNQGLAYFQEGLFEKALNCFNQTLYLKADHYEALDHKGLSYQKLKKYQEAEAAFNLAINTNDKEISAYNNKASMYVEKNDLNQAINIFSKALDLDKDNAEVLNNMAITYQGLNQYENAISFYKKACKEKPESAIFKYNLSQAYLAHLDFEEGWPLYEYREHLEELKTKFAYLNKHYINRIPTDDKPILILSEQGIGDQILFFSLLPEILKFKNKILVALDDRLIPLFARSFPAINFYSDKSDLSSLDYSYNLLAGSMGSLFRLSAVDFERQSEAYLKPNIELTKKIRASLKSDSKLICGIAWTSANKKIGQDKSLDLESYKPFFEMSNIDYIDLQYGETIQEKDRIKSQFGTDIISVDFIDKFNDIDGLAALVNTCDFIITTSNVTAHIAGALGKKTFLLVPFNQGRIWYWHDSINKSLWYPSINIYRQTESGDWIAPIMEIKKDIEFNK
jgi:tetratricopeptide (TPR) repeat protein